MLIEYKDLTQIDDKNLCIKTISYIDKTSNLYPWGENIFTNIIKNKQYYLEFLCINQNIAGVSVWLKNNVAYELLHIVIEKQYQNQGLATNWLNYMCNKFNHEYEIWLEVRQSNIIAQKLYAKCGFNVVAKRKNYYPLYENNIIIKREDAILMQK